MHKAHTGGGGGGVKCIQMSAGFPRKVGNHLPVYRLSYRRRQFQTQTKY
jgi:hypothetical protein